MGVGARNQKYSRPEQTGICVRSNVGRCSKGSDSVLGAAPAATLPPRPQCPVHGTWEFIHSHQCHTADELTVIGSLFQSSCSGIQYTCTGRAYWQCWSSKTTCVPKHVTTSIYLSRYLGRSIPGLSLRPVMVPMMLLPKSELAMSHYRSTADQKFRYYVPA